MKTGGQKPGLKKGVSGQSCRIGISGFIQETAHGRKYLGHSSLNLTQTIFILIFFYNLFYPQIGMSSAI